MLARNRCKSEKIVGELSRAEVLHGQGRQMAEAIRSGNWGSARSRSNREISDKRIAAFGGVPGRERTAMIRTDP